MREKLEPVFVPQFSPAQDVEARIGNRENENMNDPEWNWCGICCVRMVALGLALNPPDTLDMYRTAFDDYEVFKLIDGQVIGAYHEALANYIRGEFALDARAIRKLSTEDVASLVANGACFIASVSAAIRKDEETPPERKTGHLVLVFGVQDEAGVSGFVLHNSTGFHSTATQKNVFVSAKRFADCFSGCGIVIESRRN